jgi:site-specific DNA recombinase
VLLTIVYFIGTIYYISTKLVKMIGIYCRISQLKEEGADRSINDQKQLGIEFAESIGKPYSVYIDEGVSGTLPIEQRPQLQSLLDDIEEGIIDSVYVYLQDRLERNPQVRLFLRSIFLKNKVRLYTEKGEVDLNDEDQTLMEDIFSLFNAREVAKTRKRVKSVLLRNAKEGRSHGVLPYGYTTDSDKKIIIDEEEAEIVRLVFRESLAGKGVSTIAELLNNSGVPTRYNKIAKGTITTTDRHSGIVRTRSKKDIKWSGSTIIGMIKNPTYKGERNFGGHSLPTPIIIDKMQWHRVNENLQNNRNNAGKSVEHKYLLKGIIQCVRCCRNYYGRTRVNKKDNFYMCSSKRRGQENCGNRSINITIIENFIWDRFFVSDLLSNKVTKHFETANLEDDLNRICENILTLERGIKKLKQERKKIGELVIKGVFDDSDAMVQMEANKLETLEMEIKLVKEKEQERFYRQNMDNKDQIILGIKEIKAEASFNDKREIVKKYIDFIMIEYHKELKAYEIITKFNIPEMEQETWWIDVNYTFASNNKGAIIPISEKAKNMSIKDLKERSFGFDFKNLDKPLRELNLSEAVGKLEILKTNQEYLQNLIKETNTKLSSLKKSKIID